MLLKRLLFLFSILFFFSSFVFAQDSKPEKPSTNATKALEYERTEFSIPGLYPAKVVNVKHENSIIDNKIIYDAAYKMLEEGILQLTGELSLKDAWLKFIDVNDRIGLKVNPVAGPTLTTSIELTQAIVKQLEEAGLPKENIIIWDRREEQLIEAGFTPEEFPGIKIIGTERLGENGTMYDENGKLYSERMIDTTWYYWADVDGEYDAETIPYMVNGGKYSYFTKILTEMVDKVINVPILKNAGTSITLCLKNLAYGSITNTGRLHKQLWSDTIADVCAFPPIRDKVVLNIVDGIKGCYDGGPGANPQFFTEYKTLLIGTDPVAVDRIGFEIVTKKRIDEKLQEQPSERGKQFLYLAQKYGLGEPDLENIDLIKVELK